MKKFNYTEEELLKKIEEIYNSEKGKNFISHLIRSFSPINKAQYLWNDPEDKSKLKCCITGHPLLSKQTAVELGIGNIEKSLKLFTNAILSENVEEQKRAQEEKQKNLDEVYQSKLLAISSEESDKYFAPPAFEAFHNWLTHKILTGDKHINWVIKSHIKNDALKYAESNNIPVTPKEKSTLNKATNNPSKMTLGDNDVLKNLAEKFNKQNSK